MCISPMCYNISALLSITFCPEYKSINIVFVISYKVITTFWCISLNWKYASLTWESYQWHRIDMWSLSKEIITNLISLPQSISLNYFIFILILLYQYLSKFYISLLFYYAIIASDNLLVFLELSQNGNIQI